MTRKQPLHVVIIGAGLGGLAAAISTRLSGHEVTVLEQAPELGEVGAGIQIPPNSSRILQSWGLAPALLSTSVRPTSFILRTYSTGAELARQPMRGYVESTYSAPYLHIHRGDFHSILVDKARELGIPILLNARVTSLDFSVPTATLEDGRVISADLIVAADGLKSRCRELFLRRADPPKDTGDLAYRILVPTEKMRTDPLLAPLVKEPMVNYWIGPDSHVVCYLLRGEDLYNMVLICPDTLPAETAVAPATKAELVALFEKWDPRLRRLLDLVQETQKWRLQNSVEMESWSHPEGRFTLLGDACHATLPYLAQGAAMAVEDGAVLGGLLKGVGKEDLGRAGKGLEKVLERYEALRKTRTTGVVRGSSHLREIFHMRDGKEQEARDIKLRGKAEGSPMPWREPGMQRWLFGYDALGEAEREWKEGGRLREVYGPLREEERTARL